MRGTVRNITDFGVFVDIGIKTAGFIHISELSKRFIKHPLDVVSVGDILNVIVISVDPKRNRIGLSLKTSTKGEKSCPCLIKTIKKIMPPDQRAIKFVKNKLSQTMTNPDGLGELQNILLRYVGITGQIKPEIPKKLTIITCADHGVAEMNVSAYPQETTAHMTRNYLVSKGAVG